MNDTHLAVLIQLLVLILSLSVHECFHAWTADRLGDPTARFLGRVSLNPIVHSDLWGTIIFPLIGSQFGFLFGWAKPVPVRVERLRNPVRDHMLVAAAGPVSNMLMATIMFVILIVMKMSSPEMAQLIRQVSSGYFPHGGTIAAPVALVAYYGMVLNVILAIFNLIPVAPLDGAAVLSGLLPRELARSLDSVQSYSFIIFILLLITGIPQYLFDPPIFLLRRVLLSS
jgi:Zn-dependent protease